jgi:hypothetical protein
VNLGLNDNIDYDSINGDYLINVTVDHDYSVLTPGSVGAFSFYALV